MGPGGILQVHQQHPKEHQLRRLGVKALHFRCLPVAGLREPEDWLDVYGRAAAIDFYGPRYGLPRAISGHNSYYLWGPRGCTGRVVIATGSREGALLRIFEGVERVATITCAYCMPYENNLPVFVARNARLPMDSLWSTLKHFDYSTGLPV